MNKDITILVLDDEENILTSIQRLFMREEFGVAITSQYQEALEILKKENIKVVLSDQRMPHMSGVEFLTKVKEHNPDIVRILVTGQTDISAAQEAINSAQVHRFISKPWDNSALKDTVRQAICYHDLILENRKELASMREKIIALENLNRKLQAAEDSVKLHSGQELDSILASIQSTAELILSGVTGPVTDHQKGHLTQTVNDVKRLYQILERILDLATETQKARGE